MRSLTSFHTVLWVLLAVVASDITNLGGIPCHAQTEPYRIRFLDKGAEAFAPGTDLYEQTLATFHADAISRRQRMGLDPVLTERDRPVAYAYREALASLGIRVLAVSNWRNLVIAELDSVQAATLSSAGLPVRVEPIATSPYVAFSNGTSSAAALPDCWPPYYGASLVTTTTVGALPLHEAGVYGQGAVIGLIDNGFRRTLSPFAHLQVRGEYDVIYGDTVTSNDAADRPDQDGHGTLVLSIAGGYLKDTIVGVAPGATYLLAKTEDMRWERRIEEDHYALAVEWMERRGAQIISSSLGYLKYDSLQLPSTYDQLDGRTTTAAQAVNMAASFGVLCVTAAGNGGPASRSIITPADADSVIAVGGVLRSGRPYGFSSSGPTADGRIKPDVVALGAKVPCAGTGEPMMVAADGTSMATPAIAGALALLRSVYPDLPSWELRRALFESGQFPFTKDSTLGHGAPNTALAAALLGPGPVRPSIVISNGMRYAIATVFNQTPVECTLRVRPSGQTEWTSIEPSIRQHPHYVFPLDANDGVIDLEIQLEAVSGTRQRTWPFQGVASFPASGADVACGAQVPGVVTSIRTEAVDAGFALWPSVVSDRASGLRLRGASRVASVRIVGIALGSAWDASWAPRGDDVMVQLPSLPKGQYMVIATTSDGRTLHAPFILMD